jgi:hypothetical protein
MPSKNQTIVHPNPPTEGGVGSVRNENNLQSAFPNSPIYKNDINDEERKAYFQSKVMDGVVISGFGLDSFNLDFSGSPNLDDVETGGGGLPGTPYIPNLNSADGAVPSGQAPYDGTRGKIEDKDAATGRQYGSGLGGLTSPSTTSPEISSQKLGDLISSNGSVGSKSFPNSTG